MAFDGITISSIVNELNDTINGGRLYKISQPEADEIMLTIKTQSGQYRLVLSANASLPLAYLTDDNKPSPATAPNFCMLLRKHLNNGRIISITQPKFERVIDIEAEHLNELGDLCRKHIIAEFMGKHSNIILCDDNNTILDSIKHISAQTSSVREVLPGRPYFIPNTSDKINPLEADRKHFDETVFTKPVPVVKALLSSYTGISTCIAEELAYRAGVDGGHPANCLDKPMKDALYNVFDALMSDVRNGIYHPDMVTDNGVPAEFAAVKLSMYDNHTEYDSISRLIIDYYRQKEIATRIHQKSVDIRRIVTTHLERAYKKLDIQEKQINLEIALKLRDKLLEHGFAVFLTRDTNCSLDSQDAKNKKISDLRNRTSKASEVKADLYISIHQNSYSAEYVHGAQVFYYSTSDSGKLLAESIQNTLIADVDPDNTRLAKGSSDYLVLTDSPCTAVIVECGFLSNNQECRKLCTSEYQSQIASAIAKAVASWKKSQSSPQ